MPNLPRRGKERLMASTSVATRKTAEEIDEIPSIASASTELHQELAERLADVRHIVRTESELDGNVFRAVMFVDDYEDAPHAAVFQIEKELLARYPKLDFDFCILAATQAEIQAWVGR